MAIEITFCKRDNVPHQAASGRIRPHRSAAIDTSDAIAALSGLGETLVLQCEELNLLCEDVDRGAQLPHLARMLLAESTLGTLQGLDLLPEGG
ncbi:hypothetical protein ACH4U5_16880 [Streptomyces sp. NPDC020858]|uniref:hypothetical protein n=1 Tax=Streptomyces sp. NPDC020858 TaxID=3365097 RepID=UPI0037AB2DD7